MAMVTAMEAAQGSHSDNSSMDPNLWGNLQHHIGLERVYVRVSLREFFQLRVVCKEWNRLAGDREFLEASFKDIRPIPEPYFVLKSQWKDPSLLLACDHSTRLWTKMRLPSNYYSNTWVPQGWLVHYPRPWAEQKLFNLHTRVEINLPPSPEGGRLLSPLFGMFVDTTSSVGPCAWKVIKGGKKSNTQIYDSRTDTWTTTPSKVTCDESFDYNGDFGQRGMACGNGVVYIQVARGILMYVMESDLWIPFNPPPLDSDSYEPRLYILAGIGTWQDLLFLLFDDTVAGRLRIRVWQLVQMDERGSQQWMDFDSMPVERHHWLLSPETAAYSALPKSMQPRIRASFSNEYILMYVALSSLSGMERCVVFNLATKAWMKLELTIRSNTRGKIAEC